jgi:hypothetical protein
LYGWEVWEEDDDTKALANELDQALFDEEPNEEDEQKDYTEDEEEYHTEDESENSDEEDQERDQTSTTACDNTSGTHLDTVRVKFMLHMDLIKGYTDRQTGGNAVHAQGHHRRWGHSGPQYQGNQKANALL